MLRGCRLYFQMIKNLQLKWFPVIFTEEFTRKFSLPLRPGANEWEIYSCLFRKKNPKTFYKITSGKHWYTARKTKNMFALYIKVTFLITSEKRVMVRRKFARLFIKNEALKENHGCKIFPPPARPCPVGYMSCKPNRKQVLITLGQYCCTEFRYGYLVNLIWNVKIRMITFTIETNINENKYIQNSN